jgi:histidinol phosphatase-like enzyme
MSINVLDYVDGNRYALIPQDDFAEVNAFLLSSVVWLDIQNKAFLICIHTSHAYKYSYISHYKHRKYQVDSTTASYLVDPDFEYGNGDRLSCLKVSCAFPQSLQEN